MVHVMLDGQGPLLEVLGASCAAGIKCHCNTKDLV